MYNIIRDILSDKKGGIEFSCFGVWHLIYMAIIFVGITIATVFLKNKSCDYKNKIINFTGNLAFAIYILDFFLMPFAYGSIDLEKLPFHACTAMCVMSFVSRYNAFFSKYKKQFAMLGFITNLVYTIYPGGVGQYRIHPLSYRAVQTLLFHGVMTAYGLFVVLFDEEKVKFKDLSKDFTVIVSMTCWALLGNYMYNGIYADYPHKFNWFFVIQDPFNMIPTEVSQYIMPLLNVVLFFLIHFILYVIISFVNKNHKQTT